MTAAFFSAHSDTLHQQRELSLHVCIACGGVRSICSVRSARYILSGLFCYDCSAKRGSKHCCASAEAGAYQSSGSGGQAHSALMAVFIGGYSIIKHSLVRCMLFGAWGMCLYAIYSGVGRATGGQSIAFVTSCSDSGASTSNKQLTFSDGGVSSCSQAIVN